MYVQSIVRCRYLGSSPMDRVEITPSSQLVVQMLFTDSKRSMCVITAAETRSGLS